jgi:hypothetical protein
LRRKLSREEERKYKGTNSLEWIGPYNKRRIEGKQARLEGKKEKKQS